MRRLLFILVTSIIMLAALGCLFEKALTHFNLFPKMANENYFSTGLGFLCAIIGVVGAWIATRAHPEQIENLALSLPIMTLGLIEIGAMSAVVAGICLTPINWLVGVGLIIGFGFFVYLFGKMIKIKISG